MIKERIPISGDLGSKVKQLMEYAGWQEGRSVDISIAEKYYADHGVPMMKTTQRFYRKYFGLCCEWYLAQKKLKWAADFEFALFPYLVNGIKNHLEDAYFRDMSGCELAEIEQAAGQKCQPIGHIGYYYPAEVWISEYGKLYAKYEYQDEIELSITAEHGEMLQPLTNTEPVDNEFFLRDGAVYFSGLYENGLLKGIAPKDFCCWHYWGKSSTACFLSGIRLRGADPASFRVLNYAYAMDKTAVYTTSGRIPDVELAAFQVLDNGQNDSGAPQGYAKDSRQVYFHNGDGKVKIIKGAEVSSFRSLGDTYFARDEKRIYAYGKQLPKAELTSWELLGHWYSRDAKRVYYLNREIKGADRDSFTVCTPVDAAPLADHLARDKDHFYQNDEIMEETLWLEQLRKMTQEP